MTLELDGSNLSIVGLESVARSGEQVSISDASWDRIRACREMIQQKIDAHEVMYGVTTGIGEFSEVVLTSDQVREFQRYRYRWNSRT